MISLWLCIIEFNLSAILILMEPEGADRVKWPLFDYEASISEFSFKKKYVN